MMKMIMMTMTMMMVMMMKYELGTSINVIADHDEKNAHNSNQNKFPWQQCSSKSCIHSMKPAHLKPRRRALLCQLLPGELCLPPLFGDFALTTYCQVREKVVAISGLDKVEA